MNRIELINIEKENNRELFLEIEKKTEECKNQ